MNKQEKTELIEAIHKNTRESLVEVKQEILDTSKRELSKVKTEIFSHITSEVDELAAVTKRGFDEAQRERDEIMRVVSENQDRLRTLESDNYRLTHLQKQVQ